MLNISHHHVWRFPTAGVHDGAEVNARGGHVLGGADTHGMAREFRDKGFVEAGAAREVLEDARDRLGVEGGWHELRAADAAKNWPGIQVCGAEPALQMGEGFGG